MTNSLSSGGLRGGKLQNTGLTAPIPDSEELHSYFDISDRDSINPLRNETTESDLATGGSPTLLTGQKNGLNVVSYDGANDFHEGVFNYSISPPYTMFLAFKWDETTFGNNKCFLSAGDGSFRFLTRDEDYRMNSTNKITGGSTDTNWHIGTLYWDNGSNSVLRIDGTQIVSGDAGQYTLGELGIGYNDSGQNHIDSKLGELAIYPTDKTSIQNDVEQYLSDKWNISL
jgi:hypothetical protein